MISLRFLAVLTAFAAAAWMPSPVYAQGEAAGGWQDGFFIQSADGDFRLQVGLLLPGVPHATESDAREVSERHRA